MRRGSSPPGRARPQDDSYSRQSILVRGSQPKPSLVYETFWRFARERQEVYHSRLEGVGAPWTSDPIIRTHRFTNAYRAADRVSQYLIRHVIYPEGKEFEPEDFLFRILIFKLFNRIDTWQLLCHEFGEVRWQAFSFRDYDRILSRAIESGTRIYSAAYIMPACQQMAQGRKHRGHLRLIEKMVNDGLAAKLNMSKSMCEAFGILQTYPMMGNFLAFQYLIDLNYSPLMDFPEDDFVVPGPGAIDGLRKTFADPGDYSEADLIRYVADRQEVEFNRLDLQFRTLWGRRLQLIDCQNLFCEVDKYARVFHPEVAGRSGRTRIKQKYISSGAIPRPWFPPKWNINEAIQHGTTKLTCPRDFARGSLSFVHDGSGDLNTVAVG